MRGEEKEGQEEDEEEELEEEEEGEEYGDWKMLFFFTVCWEAITARRTREPLLRFANPTFWVRSTYFGNEGEFGEQGVEHGASGRRIWAPAIWVLFLVKIWNSLQQSSNKVQTKFKQSSNNVTTLYDHSWTKRRTKFKLCLQSWNNVRTNSRHFSSESYFVASTKNCG